MIITPRGAKITILEAPEHLGPGVMLVMTMVDRFDRRRVEVFLDPDAQLDLAKELLAKHDPGVE